MFLTQRGVAVLMLVTSNNLWVFDVFELDFLICLVFLNIFLWNMFYSLGG